jgi:Tol biopolymer transport system component
MLACVRGVAGLVVAAAVALAASGGGGSRVATARTGLFEIGADGSGGRLLVGDPGLLLDLSPSRDQALLLRQSPGGFDLDAIDLASGRERVLVPTTDWILTATWSPNGKTIAFDGQSNRVWLVGAGGRRLRMLASRAREPSWAPDSHRVVYVGHFDATTKRGRLTIARVDGRSQFGLGRRGEIASPRWSPDGDWLAYLGASKTLRVIRVDGRRLHRFGVADEPAWSRGGRIAFIRRRAAGRARLDVLNPRTGRERALAAGWDLDGPAWSPDGRQIAFARYTGGACGSNTELDVVSLAGAGRKVTALPSCAQVARVFWSRDGRDLFYVSY